MPVSHRWDLSPAEARTLQKELASQVDTTTPLASWDVIAAVDGSYGRYDTEIAAAIVVVRADTLEVIERVGVIRPLTFPYVPGLLSFREAPALLDAFAELRTSFDVIMADGQGIAHPRRLGIGSHLGICLDKPTVGCAKSRLYGDYVEPGPKRGDRSPLVDKKAEVIGAVLRTKDRVKPLFVSPGHRCDLQSAVALVLATSGKYRLPGPARMAHEFVNEVRRRPR
jgi:deoxyribonuclease V